MAQSSGQANHSKGILAQKAITKMSLNAKLSGQLDQGTPGLAEQPIFFALNGDFKRRHALPSVLNTLRPDLRSGRSREKEVG